MTQNQAPLAPQKQLKKSDFLNVVSEAPMTKGDLVEALDGYSYIGTYLDYLTDHFLAQGKIVRNEDGTIQRKGKKVGGASGEIHRVVDGMDEDGNTTFTLESRKLDKGETLNKEDGWALTKNRAVKNATSAEFAYYKARIAAINSLLGDDEPVAE